MVNYTCDCCFFLTNKKSTYNDHLTSKKHLNKINNISVTSSNNSIISSITEPELQDDSSSLVKIRDLENELKLKELEINNLKELLKVKDEMISFLKSTTTTQHVTVVQPPQPVKENITMTIEEKESKEDERPTKLTPKQVIEQLTLTRKDAPTIDEFLKTGFLDENNKYFKTLTYKGGLVNKNGEPVESEKKLIYYDKNEFCSAFPDTEKGLFYFSSYTNLIVNMFCSLIERTEKTLSPLYCNDKQRRVFYVKLQEGWKRLSDDEFNSLCSKIISRTEFMALNAISNTKTLFLYHNSIYRKFYANGFTNEDSFNDNYSVAYLITSNIKNECHEVITKHIKAKLSEITGDKIVKFKPLKDEIIKLDVEEETPYGTDED